MSRWARAGLVSAGYPLAIAAAGVAGHLYNARVSALPYDTSGGMYAASFIGVSGNLFPTGCSQ